MLIWIKKGPMAPQSRRVSSRFLQRIKWIRGRYLSQMKRRDIWIIWISLCGMIRTSSRLRHRLRCRSCYRHSWAPRTSRKAARWIRYTSRSNSLRSNTAKLPSKWVKTVSLAKCVSRSSQRTLCVQTGNLTSCSTSSFKTRPASRSLVARYTSTSFNSVLKSWKTVTRSQKSSSLRNWAHGRRQRKCSKT